MNTITVTKNQKLAGIGLILATGILHLVEAPEYFAEVKYIGALFVASMIGAAAAALMIRRDDPRGWMLGFGVAGGSAIAYLLSRTVGLPMFRENSWSQFLEPMGLLCLLVEAGFLAVALPVLAPLAGSSRRTRSYGD